MRPAVVALVACATLVAALCAASACGGGTAAGDPLNTRETPTSGLDSPPTGEESPGPGYESPGAGYEAPPVAGDPANQAGGGSCIPCSGVYACTAPQISSGTLTVTLKPTSSGGCSVFGLSSSTSSSSGKSIDDFPACGSGLPASGSDDGVSYSVTRTGGGGFKVCLEFGAGSDDFSGCATCTPTTQAAGSGSGASSSSGASISIGFPSNTSSSGGDGCSALASCCGQLQSFEQPSCTQTVAVGNSLACSDSLMGFQDANECN